jgi:hypothetical protein
LVDLLARMEESRRNPDNSHIEVMLYYYKKHPCCNKSKYDHTNSKLPIVFTITTLERTT